MKAVRCKITLNGHRNKNNKCTDAQFSLVSIELTLTTQLRQWLKAIGFLYYVPQVDHTRYILYLLLQIRVRMHVRCNIPVQSLY